MQNRSVKCLGSRRDGGSHLMLTTVKRSSQKRTEKRSLDLLIGRAFLLRVNPVNQ